MGDDDDEDDVMKLLQLLCKWSYRRVCARTCASVRPLQTCHDYAQSVTAVNTNLNSIKTGVKAKVLSYPILPDFQNSVAFWEIPRLLPFVLLERT